MDKEQARFILQSFRPDGADAQDPDFAQALAVAAADRELGNWLAGERAQDAAFAAALNELEIPEDLRRNILSVLGGEEAAEADFSELDATFVGALAAVQPPDGLRDQIVTAMEVESSTRQSAGSPAASAPQRVGGWLKSAAVAAAVVLGAFVAMELTGGGDRESDQAKRTPEDRTPRERPVQPDPHGNLTVRSLESQFIRNVAAGPSLALQERDLGKLFSYLEEQHGPATSAQSFPRGLKGLEGKGCQLLRVGKTNASLLCFDKDGETVHLVVVRREDLAKSEKLLSLSSVKSNRDSCHQCPVTKVSVATWGDDDNAFFLLSKTDPDKLRKQFF